MIDLLVCHCSIPEAMLELTVKFWSEDEDL